MGLPQPVKRFTPQEYYALEQVAEYKSDFYDGEIFDMSGGTVRHSQICINISGELRQRLKGAPCQPFESNLRLMIERTGLRCYPDVSVYRGPLRRDAEDPSGETVTNPAVIFEVLSKSTEGYDRGVKAESFRQIDSLQAYVFVSQESPHVESYERSTNGNWVLRDFRGMDGSFTIAAIGVELPLSEIYARVDFTKADPATQA